MNPNKLRRLINRHIASGCLHACALMLALHTAPVAAQAPPAEGTYSVRPPASVRVAYDVEGVISSPYSGSAELVWTQDGKRYQSQLLIRKFGLTLQAWTSQGSLSERGLEPDTFTSKRLGQAEIYAHFRRDAGRVRFSEGTPDAALQSGAQDQLSVFMQLASLLAGGIGQGAAGKTIRVQAIGDRYAEQWAFKASSAETIKLAAGSLQALKFTHEPTAERKQRLELWYPAANPTHPARIRITESNGDYLDLVWANGQNR